MTKHKSCISENFSQIFQEYSGSDCKPYNVFINNRLISLIFKKKTHNTQISFPL